MNITPHHQISEQNVIGSCLVNKECVGKVLKKISVNDFYYANFAQIYEIIQDLHAKDRAIDVITVAEKYNNIDILTRIATETVTTAHIDEYIDIVKQFSIRRQYIKACNQIIHWASDFEHDNILDFHNESMKQFDIPLDFRKKDYKMQSAIVEFMEDMERLKNKGETSILKTGYKFIDECAGGALTGLTYIGARPSVGKSTFVINVAVNMIKQDKAVALFNLEMTNNEILSKKMSIVSRVANKKIRESWDLTDEDWASIAHGYVELAKHEKVHLIDDMYTIEEIRAFCRELKTKDMLDIIFIDYLQLMNSVKKYKSRYELMTEISRQIKLMQQEFKVPVWVLAQLNRNAANKEPELHELKESGGIEQDADRVFMLHDPEYGKNQSQREVAKVSSLELLVKKNRFGTRDIKGYLQFYKNTQTMYDN